MNTHHPTQTHTNPKACTCSEVTRRITQETQKQTKSQQPHTQCDCQMLASTIHKTNNHHTPEPPPQKRDDNPWQWKETTTTHKRVWACSPTTQQRACPHPHTTVGALHPRAPHSSTQVQKFRSVPPMSTPHTHHGCQGLPQHTPQPTTQNVTVNFLECVCMCCSLERR